MGFREDFERDKRLLEGDEISGEEARKLMQKYSVRLTWKPKIELLEDGSWVAQYPGQDWKVTAVTQEELGEKIRIEYKKHMTPEKFFELVWRNMEHPEPGIVVQRNELGEQHDIMADPDYHLAEYERVIAERDNV